MRKKEKDMAEGGSFVSATPASATSAKPLSPLDIQQKEFGVSRLGGYRMRDVDEFLDQVTEAMSAVIKENEQLRKGAGVAPVVGTSDLADVNRQADEIIQRARDEAARIVAEAREQAAALPAGGAVVAAGAVSVADRAAINAFLTREKEFLQSLAGLVQGHAEGVKSMARSARPAKAAPAPAVVPTPANPVPVASRDEGSKAEAASPEATVALPKPVETPKADQKADPKADQKAERNEERVSVVEPEPAAVRRSESEPDALEDGDGSLRELFWGED
jgi:DivIVA domain-containing protein